MVLQRCVTDDFFSIQPRLHIRSVGDVVDVVNIVTVVVGSIGGILALLADSAGVGAVELLAVSRQRVS